MSPPRGPTGPDRGPQPVGSSLGRVLAKLGASPSPETMDVIFSRWPEVAGPELAAHVRPLRLQKATLVVAADHAAWATRARLASEEVLGRIHALGDRSITRLEVVVQRP